MYSWFFLNKVEGKNEWREREREVYKQIEWKHRNTESGIEKDISLVRHHTSLSIVKATTTSDYIFYRNSYLNKKHERKSDTDLNNRSVLTRVCERDIQKLLLHLKSCTL